MGDQPDERGFLVYSATYPNQKPHAYYSGGAGLVSTITDYARFLQMLLNGGQLDGARLLSRKTVELMTVNHVGDMFGPQGFGLGFSGVALPAAVIMALTLASAVKPDLQGILLTSLALALFVVAMWLAPRLGVHPPFRQRRDPPIVPA